MIEGCVLQATDVGECRRARGDLGLRPHPLLEIL